MPIDLDGEPELETIIHLLTGPCFALVCLRGAFASSSAYIYSRVVQSAMHCNALFGLIDAGASA